MTTAPTTQRTPGPAAAKGARPKRTPLSHVEDVSIVRGRRQLRGYYPSSRRNVADHATDVLDDGTVLGCTCPGYGDGCWHTDTEGAQAIVVRFHYDRWYMDTTDALVARDAELRDFIAPHAWDQREEDAARLELTAVGDVLGERAAKREAA